MPERIIRWNEKAILSFVAQIEFIKENSLQNAETVERNIQAKIDKLLKYPESCSPDKFKSFNPHNNYRAFELHRLRISYFVSDTEIRIVRVRHTSQTPRWY
jgi:plasmid stabilization system protein ParE